MPWDEEPNTGFCPPQANPRLPTYAAHRAYSVAAQQDDPHSHLALTRALLRLRRDHRDLHAGSYRSLDAPADVLAYRRGDAWAVALNLGHQDITCRSGAGQVVLSTHLDRHEHTPGEIRLRADEGIVLRLDP